MTIAPASRALSAVLSVEPSSTTTIGDACGAVPFTTSAMWASSLKAAISAQDRKSTRLNSSHQIISYAVFCLKKKKTTAKTRLHSLLPVRAVSTADEGEQPP